MPADPAALLVTDHHPRMIPLIRDLEARRGSTVLTYHMTANSNIQGDAVAHMYEHLCRLGHRDQIDLYLNSTGGATEVPWRMVPMIREFCDRFCVLVPNVAASAATHISLGADEIVMTELSQLGPVDPIRFHPLLPLDPSVPDGQPKRPLAISVQDLRHFTQFVERQGDLESKDVAAICTALMDHVHPLVIGAMEQSYALAKLITENMLSLHMDPVAEAAEIKRLVDHLSDDFMSHIYPINRREAAAMGLKVVNADDLLRDSMWAIHQAYELQPPQFPPAVANGGPADTVPCAFIDSTVGSSVAVGLMTGGQPVGSGWLEAML